MAVAKVVAKSGHKFVDQVSQTPETKIAVGDSVEWTSTSNEHTIVSDNVAPFDTMTPPLAGDVDNGSAAYVVRFDTAGLFGYHCDIHGGDPVAKTGMYGIVKVESPPAKK